MKRVAHACTHTLGFSKEGGGKVGVGHQVPWASCGVFSSWKCGSWVRDCLFGVTQHKILIPSPKTQATQITQTSQQQKSHTDSVWDEAADGVMYTRSQNPATPKWQFPKSQIHKRQNQHSKNVNHHFWTPKTPKYITKPKQQLRNTNNETRRTQTRRTIHNPKTQESNQRNADQ